MLSQLRRALSSALRRSRQNRELRRRFPDLVLGEHVVMRCPERISIGTGCFFDTGVYLNAGSLDGTPGYIQFGDYCEIAPYSVLYGHGGIRIGNDVRIGPHVTITAHESQQIAPATQDASTPLTFRSGPIVIEDHVIVCAGAVIAPGVTLGHHSMIAANTLISRDVPPYAFVRGIPGEVIRYSTDARSA